MSRVVGIIFRPVATKSQHSQPYQSLPLFLRELREEAGLSQRDLGRRLGKPQSWIYNCESANRRVDITEFIGWAISCGIEPGAAFARFLEAETRRQGRKKKE
ncbi:helix-turn-helix domain-containing protein [Zavarzinella formosa]|uniref:helix-turn-helix domain-containing protein n=1 Tax=Zavarzinella formosa TaxID=360055 RepID=UPI000A071967